MLVQIEGTLAIHKLQFLLRAVGQLPELAKLHFMSNTPFLLRRNDSFGYESLKVRIRRIWWVAEPRLFEPSIRIMLLINNNVL